MNILVFPTRYYPAISGGDFCLQRIAEEYQKSKKRENQYISYYKSNQVCVISSDAIDFAALRKNGRIVSEKHRNFSCLNNVRIIRFNVERKEEKISIEKNRLKKFITKYLDKSLVKNNQFIEILMKNGPILPRIHDFLEHGIKLQEIVGFKPDIIHCSYLPYNNILYALILGYREKIPVVITPFLHQENIRYHNTSIFEIMDFFSQIYACTSNERNIFIKNGIKSSKVFIVPMGVDFKKFKPNNQYISNLLNVFEITHPLVLFCGYKNFEKGSLTLLKSIPLITKLRSDVNFLLIGPNTKAYQFSLNIVKKNCPDVKIFNLTPSNLHGVYDPIKIGAFQFADVFCMPSRSDAFGIVYLEAWATKTPVIAANTPQMQDVIVNHHDGILVPFDNPTKLSEAILRLINNEDLREKLAKNGYKKVVPHLSWHNVAQNYYKLYTVLQNK